MEQPPLTAVSPLDGRYAAKCAPLRDLFSEQGLIRLRVLVQVRWVQFLAEQNEFDGLGPFSPVVSDYLNALIDAFSADDARRIKEIEATTNHDVKAVEYFLAEKFGNDPDLSTIRPFLHFACTSEDVNNVAYALMLREGRDGIVIPALRRLIGSLRGMAESTAALPMLSRTHGQAASPTTMGKELANFIWRLERQIDSFADVVPLAKMNGAVGNFNAHVVAYPAVDWITASNAFINSLGLQCNPYTTQIEPHDWVAEYCDALARINTVLIDASHDLWGYISLGYFEQSQVPDEVGSSTMPHKVNPIDFENAEGNLGIANALLKHFSAKLPVSRWQRDLSDSTVQRNLGVAIAHGYLAYHAMLNGLERLQVNPERLAEDIESCWELLAEPIQTVMRRHGDAGAYDRLKSLTRGTTIDPGQLRAFIETLELPQDARNTLLELTPASYTGLAEELVRRLDRFKADKG